ncbi:MAG: MFS transporter [Spirochaetaceae bacterium]|nr:MFS transporter [Spirochaetaceae bacterium]
MSSTVDRVHSFLTDEELRSCDSIPEEACQESPGNFFKNIINGTLTRLAERIIHPGITLPWIFSALGASGIWIGLLVPARDAGSLLPQLFVSARIRTLNVRKWVWVLSAIIQGLCLLFSGLAIQSGNHTITVPVLFFLFLLFAIASGVASLAYKDVTAKTIPSGQRGTMLSYRALFGALLSVPAGLGLLYFVRGTDDVWIYAMLFYVATALWWMAALIFSRIVEFVGATGGGRNPWKEAKAGIGILRGDRNFLKFLLVRALLFLVPLMLPYISLMGRQDDSVGMLGSLILVGGLAEMISSPFWGRQADHSSRKLLQISCLLGVFIAVAALILPLWLEDRWLSYACLGLVFVHSIVYSGARLARKTYLVDYAPKEDRSTYISVANTFMGFFTAAAAGFAFLGQSGFQWLLLVFAVLLILGFLLASSLDEATHRAE